MRLLIVEDEPDLARALQKFLEEQRFEPVGSNTPVSVDVRVISATNQPLESLIDNGHFRPDLFYRLNVIPFQIPPLRERREDVPILVDHFNKKFSLSYGKKPKLFNESALQALQDADWLGNVRELKNTIERIVIMSGKKTIGADDLPELGGTGERPASSFRFPSFKDATDAYQREFIQHKLSEFDGNVTKAAEEMGVRAAKAAFRELRRLARRLTRSRCRRPGRTRPSARKGARR